MIDQSANTVVILVCENRDVTSIIDELSSLKQKPRCSVRVTENDTFTDLTCHQINNPIGAHAHQLSTDDQQRKS